MPTLEKVTDITRMHEFCLTDCGPSDGCNPDDYIPADKNSEKKEK